MNRTAWQWLRPPLRTITLIGAVCGLGLAALCVLRPAKPLPVSAGGVSRPVPLNPLSGVSSPPVVDRVPRYGQGWAEGRFVDDLLVITDDGGANCVFEPHSRRLDSCDALESIGDIAPEASGLLACYGTAWEGQIAKAQCGGQTLWTARLWSDPDREEDLDIRHVGTRVFAVSTGAGKSQPSLTVPTREVFAIDAATGHLLWKHALGRGPLAHIAGVGSAVVIAELHAEGATGESDYVFVRSDDGRRLGVRHGLSDEGAAAVPSEVGHRWFAIPSDSRVRAYPLDVPSAVAAWGYDTPGRVVRLLPAGHLLVAEVESPTTMLVALQASSGRPAWSLPQAAGTWRWEAASTGGGDLFVIREQTSGPSVVRVAEGRVAWEWSAPSDATLRFADGRIGTYVVALEGKRREPEPRTVVVLEAESGKLIGRYGLSSAAELTQVLVLKDDLLVLSVAGGPGREQPTYLLVYPLSQVSESRSGA
jgi:outer membrane protein assembly factor BamB